MDDGSKATGQGYWGRTADELVEAATGESGAEDVGDSGLMDELRRVIVEKCSETEGIFRIAPNVRIYVSTRVGEAAFHTQLGGKVETTRAA